MSDYAITVEHLSKRYSIGRRDERGEGLRHALERVLRNPFGSWRRSVDARRAPPTEFWALRDVSLDVASGEVVGIIGPNGAGKSTLLKILSRVTEPTAGRIRLAGRVASLLEVGTGFHPELTGRENIFLNGAILGMRRAEIRTKFDAIVEFAEIERFLDTPVKRYSSGMFVRLAFAVAVHLEPEILIVDEVLAVGDARYQKKCLSKMQDVSSGEGRTVLFVSHNMQAISTLTTRCLLLRSGRCVLEGTPAQAIAAYLDDGTSGAAMYSSEPSVDGPSVTRVEIETSEPNNTHVHAKPLRVAFEVTTPTALANPVFHFQIADSLQQPVVHLMFLDADRSGFCRAPGTYRLVCEVPCLRLYLGRYTITTHLEEAYGTWIHYQTLEGLCSFEVVMYGHEREWPWQEGRCRYLEEGRWFVEDARDLDGSIDGALVTS